jgi:hypothetical protein
VETTNLDDLELELRKLPGVRAAGFTERDDMLLVQVQVAGDEPTSTLSQQAARIAYRHADKPVALEIVRWRTIAAPPAPDVAPPPTTPEPSAESVATTEEPAEEVHQRVRLLAVLTFPDTDELEVHLTFGGRRIIGRSTASAGITGAVAATLEGLRNFDPDLGGAVGWVTELTEETVEGAYVIACAITLEAGVRMGIASGGSRIEAAARAALHALNRALDELAETDRVRGSLAHRIHEGTE